MCSHLDHREAAKEAAADAKGSSEEKGNQFVLTGNNVNIMIKMEAVQFYLEDRFVSGECAEKYERKQAESCKRPEHQLPLGPGVTKPSHQLASQVGGMEHGEEEDRHPVKKAARDNLGLHPREDGHGDQVAGGDGQHVGPDQGHHLHRSGSRVTRMCGQIKTTFKRLRRPAARPWQHLAAFPPG